MPDRQVVSTSGNPAQVQSSASAGQLPVAFFVLVFVLAVPFWLFGGGRLPLPMNLPVGALVTFVPALAASILAYRRDGLRGIKELIQRAWDYRRTRDKRWYLPALFLPPLICFAAYVVQRTLGWPLPDPIRVPLLLAPAFFVMFFIADAGEELGWSGYAIDPLQERWGALRAGFLLGGVWAIWHAIPYLQTHNPADWILWQSVSAIAVRVLILWIYNNTGKSVFAAILYHVMTNISWSLYPNYGSHFDPFLTGLLTWLAVLIVILTWEPRTLARLRHSSIAQS